MKKLTITVEYTDDNPDEGQLLSEELEWVTSMILDSHSQGYNDYSNAMGEMEVVTTYKIEEVQDGE